MLIAHSENKDGRSHPLEEHLKGVSILCEEFARKFSGGKLGKYIGLWHDIGKAHPGFQRYLQSGGKTQGQDHKGAGTQLAVQYFQPLTFLIAGHHGGLPDQSTLKRWIQEKCNNELTTTALHIIHQSFDDLINPSKLSFPPYLDTADWLEIELFLRLLFSALVDADFLDTEHHFNQTFSSLRGVRTDFDIFWARFQTSQTSLAEKAEETVVNKARQIVYNNCIERANQDQGVYRLTVPTGGGKTRSGLGFALKHAQIHHLDRIIICLPFTSIIEQNAKVYREILGDQYILEHHSNITWKDPENSPDPSKAALRLASENWDAPIIVTTTVQFFESLFGNRTSQCRKLHNITRSCIILDEVQSLPSFLLPIIVDGLKQLVEHYNCTVVLSTATQPSLDDSPVLSGFPTVNEIIPNPDRLFSDLQRVNYVNTTGERWTDEQFVDMVSAESQILCVVNTRKDAQRIWYLWDDPEVYHLSSAMCAAHRTQTLETIKEKLAHNEPCKVISTQVIEAGVDIDFPVVYRAVAPLDSIVQSAGRCNREGKQDTGRVVVFDLEEGGLPQGSYRTGTDIARQFLQRKEMELNSPKTFPVYFRKLYQSVSLDPENIQEDRRNLRFQTVANKFQMIRDDTETILANYHRDYVETQVQYLKNHSILPRIFLRNIQPYTVSVSHWQHKQMIRNNLVNEIYPGIWITTAQYHKRLGLLTDKQDPVTLIH